MRKRHGTYNAVQLLDTLFHSGCYTELQVLAIKFGGKFDIDSGEGLGLDVLVLAFQKLVGLTDFAHIVAEVRWYLVNKNL